MYLSIALAVVAAICLALAWFANQARDEAEQEAFDATCRRIDAQVHAEEAIQPLQWAYDLILNASGSVPPAFERRMKAYLANVYVEIQGVLKADDQEMAVFRDQARLNDPPRRMPRYPQVPPYLATVEDIAGVSNWRGQEGLVAGPEGEAVDLTDAILDPVTQAEAHVEIGKRLDDVLGPPTLDADARNEAAQVDRMIERAEEEASRRSAEVALTWMDPQGDLRLTKKSEVGYHGLTADFERLGKNFDWATYVRGISSLSLPLNTEGLEVGQTISIKHPTENSWWPFTIEALDDRRSGYETAVSLRPHKPEGIG